MSSSACTLPDSFVRFCSDQPASTFCWNVEVDSDSTLLISNRTRAGLIQDVNATAQRFLHSGPSRRRCGAPLVNVCFFARSSYDLFVGFLAALINRWTPTLISDKNSPEGVTHLVRASGSQYLFVDTTHPNLVDVVQRQIPNLQIIPLQSDDGTIAPNPIADPPVDQDHDLDLDIVAYNLHTSGSTGHPKLIPVTHRQWYDQTTRLTSFPGRVVCTPMPMFHTVGLTCLTKYTIGAGCIPVIIESTRPCTGELLCNILGRFDGAICVSPPSLLEEISLMGEGAIQVLSSTYMVLFAGAPLQEPVGNVLASHGVKIISVFGTTETGQLTVADVSSDDPLDWSYVRFIDPSAITLVDVPNTRNLRRLVVKPGRFVSSDLVNHHHPVGFSPGDLWREHPTRKGLWKHAGRMSSVTVLANGEKTDNEQLERLVLKNPFVERVIVFGEGRLQNGLLVLPKDVSSNDADFATSLQSTVQHMNSIIPKHSRVVQALVVFGNLTKPFALTDKGTIRRHETLALYSEEIQEAYAALESGVPFRPLPLKDDHKGILMYIQAIATRVLGMEVAVEDDLFSCGMDSLSAANFTAYLTPLWKLVQDTELPRNIVYKYSSIDSLHQVLTGRISHVVHRNNAEKIDAIIKKWTFPNLAPASRSSYLEPMSSDIDDGRVAVLLTGSTGAFGSHVLSELVQREGVYAVYCLNRADSRSSGTHTLQIRREATSGKGDTKVEFWSMELGKPDLGLDAGTVQKIHRDVTHIVHCAWDVNFNHELEHFIDPHVRALHTMLELSASSVRAKPPRIFFISSVSAVANYSGPEHAIPEVPFDSSSLPLDQGYAQSKYVAERVLIDASRAANIPVTIVRAGQLAGDTALGAWNVMEHIPIFIQACCSLKLMPSQIPNLSWTPIDVASAILVDIMLKDPNRDTTNLLVRHIDSPKELTSSCFLQWMVEASGNTIVLVSNEKWLDSVRNSPMVLKAKHLLPFFEQWLSNAAQCRHRVLSVQDTKLLSGSFSQAQITPELFRQYVDFILRSNSLSSSV
ncbi:putative alpha-aminoadipate reductase [Suillus luteus UH-Slu-Lm8-n1]|uniref:Putative alpha-aminoadipate reductase n=1 Tax=Suillus luteus UH-Slu-Lm8-n1 TaxID=930992 RepID=A0A0D0B9V7_9AGAM|nr:putative alpha-aminoadipate reductase [Suillus luteus UH-Slu-Lm8-n1]